MYWYDGKLVNSEQIQLSINDPGLIYGANVFSTMRVYEKSLEHSLTNWPAHCDRLGQSLQELKWNQPHWKRLKQGAELLCEYFPVLRMVIFPDGREWITGRNLPIDLEQRQTLGITAWIAKADIYRRTLAQHKTGNYLAAHLARNHALSLNAQEAILVDSQGNWLETSTGNLWGWGDNCWYTPSLDSGILPGIGRSQIINRLQNSKIQVRQNLWTPQFVKSLEGILYSNCVVETIPIKRVSGSGDRLNYSEYSIVNLP
jgi:4-amino-4-deoxychorismate lyase